MPKQESPKQHANQVNPQVARTTPELWLVLSVLAVKDMNDNSAINASRTQYFQTPTVDNLAVLLKTVGISQKCIDTLSADFTDKNSALFIAISKVFQYSLLKSGIDYPTGGCLRHGQTLTVMAQLLGTLTE